MIKSFADKETESLFYERISRIEPKIKQRAMYKLAMLDSCIDIQLFKIPPANQLEKLKGFPNRWSVRINQQWRLTFDCDGQDSHNVKVEDYVFQEEAPEEFNTNDEGDQHLIANQMDNVEDIEEVESVDEEE